MTEEVGDMSTSGTDHESLHDSTTPRLQRGPSNGRMAFRTAEIHSTGNKEHAIVPKTVPGACHSRAQWRKDSDTINGKSS